MMAFVRVDWALYIAYLVAFLGVVVTTTCRSLITKMVGPFEVGKVFAVLAAFQAVMPLVARPAYGTLYRFTITEFPGTFVLFSAGLYVLAGIIQMVVHRGLVAIERQKELDDLAVKEKLLETDSNCDRVLYSRLGHSK